MQLCPCKKKITTNLHYTFAVIYKYSCVCTELQLQFGGNVGNGLYQFSYQENNDTSGIESPLPPQFQVRCSLNNMEPSNVSYSLLTNGDGTFRIDKNTGILAFQDGRRFDYETRREYIMSAACNITSNPSINRGVAQINFNVLPVNEFKPVIRIIARPRFGLFIDEFSEVGQIIAIREQPSVVVPSDAYVYVVEDRDEGESEEVTLHPSSSLDSALFLLEPTGTITLAKKLDLDDGTRPMVNVIDVRVCNSDPPTGINCGNLFFSVILTWSNDNDPTFSQDIYAVTIPENLSPSSVIANVSCTDGDYIFGAFDDVTSSSPLFNVCVVPGSDYQPILLTAQLDYEEAQAHSVTLTCTDNGGKNTTAKLVVTIMPINDNQPRFIKNRYIFQVNRFLTLGSEIGRIQALDDDQDEGNTLTYTLTNSTNFQIESDGTIFLRDFVYVVDGQIFQLLAVVSDGQFNGTVQVTITMTGVVSIPEVILICMGIVVFIVLVILIIVCRCYIRVCCSRL